MKPSLKPSELPCKKGMPFAPSAVDIACSHLGETSREVTRAKDNKSLVSKLWCPSEFEKVAEEIDHEDFKRSEESQ